jgi:hypothetical protein
VSLPVDNRFRLWDDYNPPASRWMFNKFVCPRDFGYRNSFGNIET